MALDLHPYGLLPSPSSKAEILGAGLRSGQADVGVQFLQEEEREKKKKDRER